MGGGQTSSNEEEKEFLLLLSFSKGADTRKKILDTILLDFKNCAQIAKNLNLNWRTVDRNLKILYDRNYVKSVKIGRREFFKISRKGEIILDSIKNKNLDKESTPLTNVTVQRTNHSSDCR